MKVYVYRNLHKNCFSIKALQGAMKGKVIGHTDEIHLTDVEFRVSEKGRQRVLRQKKKYVHAGVVGVIASPRDVHPDDTVLVRYNPYETSTFVLANSNEPVYHAAYAKLTNNRIFIQEVLDACI